MKYANLTIAFFLAACSSRGEHITPGVDAGASDLGVVDTDSGQVDAAAIDEGISVDLGTDAGRDGSTPVMDASVDSGVHSGVDAGDVDAGPCNYIEWNPFLVHCGDTLEQGVSFFNTEGSTEECPEYFVFMDHRGTTAEEAVAAADGCDTACVYMATLSADGVYCGVRFSYDVLHAAAGDDACPPIYAYGGGPADSEGHRGGYYSSPEEYAADHPCDTEPVDPPAE